MPPAAKNLFEKRFLDFQKLLLIYFLVFSFLCVPSCHYLSTSCFFSEDFCDGSPGAPISAPLWGAVADRWPEGPS